MSLAALRIQEILLPNDPRRSTLVLFRGPQGLPQPVFINPHDATVLGTLSAGDWLPGLSRALHGGWPLGKPGSWLLELGDGWAIFMIASGLYLWWPRSRRFRECLWPRLHLGSRIAMRDLHAIVAVLFSAVFLFFLISALPWTAFWGQEILLRVQTATGQTAPFEFSPGGAKAQQFIANSSALDDLVATARIQKLAGTLDIKLAPWPSAPFNISNRDNSPADDRVVIGDRQSGRLIGAYSNDSLPIIPRIVTVGIHVHQGDFGPVNIWINTAFALSLAWMTATGLASWWLRRPAGRLGVPAKRSVEWHLPMKAAALFMCIILPIFGISVAIVAGVDKLITLGRKAILET